MSNGNGTVCAKCGSCEFKLMRTAKGQILAECLKCAHPHLMEGVNILWSPEREEDNQKKTSERTETRKEILEEFKDKSLDASTNEMVEFIEKESLKDVSFYDITRIFWNKKGLDLFIYSGDPDFVLKRLRVERAVREKLHCQDNISPKQHEKEKELPDSTKPKILKQAKQKQNKKRSE